MTIDFPGSAHVGNPVKLFIIRSGCATGGVEVVFIQTESTPTYSNQHLPPHAQSLGAIVPAPTHSTCNVAVFPFHLSGMLTVTVDFP